MKFNVLRISVLFLSIFFFWNDLSAQNNIQRDFSQVLSIPNLIELEASSTHMYALSETEGLAVFRVYSDSIQWLYTSSGMQRRGNTIEADIRFAYQYGKSRRLTVLEPTSVLGVYSSTMLPRAPLGVARLENSLFIALDNEGLGMLSLETPETVDSDIQVAANGVIGRANVLDVASSVVSNQLFVLTNDQKMHAFTLKDGELAANSTLDLGEEITHIFVDDDLIWGSSTDNELFEITATGLGRSLGKVTGTITKLVHWDNRILVRTNNGSLWESENRRKLTAWNENVSAGNYITKSKNEVWLGSFDKLTKLIGSNTTNSSSFSLQSVPNKIITFPSPLLFAVQFDENSNPADIELAVRSTTSNAKLQGQGFYWQPTVNQIGFHQFTIIATNSAGQVDSTSFSVDVRTFNAPPRFSPVRGSSIVANDAYELKFNAIDPENPEQSLIRYLGVDLPEGAKINEKTGLFTWTPTSKQEGEHTFKIIATDEQGAAASQEITFKVIDLGQQGQ